MLTDESLQIKMKLTQDLQAPIAPKRTQELEAHGDTRIDNYYWLNQRENQEVLDYLTAENEYCSNVMKPLNKFREELVEEMRGRIKETDMSVPYKSDGWYYYTRFEEGEEYPIYCRKEKDLTADEEVMLDVNLLAKGHEYYQVARLALSPNKKILAFGEDAVSRRIYTIRFKNLETGELYPFKIENTSGSVAWAQDSKTLFYTRKDKETLREYQICKYVFGSNSPSEVIYEEFDETFTCHVYKSKSQEYIFIESASSVSSEYRFINAGEPQSEFKIIEKRQRDHEYGVGHIGQHFYILSNWKAKNFRLMRTSIHDVGKNSWEEIIPHREDVLIEDIELFSDYVVLEERIKGIVNIRVINQLTKDDFYIDFGEDSYTAYCATNMEFNSHVLRIGYTSLTTPNSAFDFDMNSKQLSLLKEQEVLGEFDRNNYLSKRLNVEVRDGLKVPLSLVHHKNTQLDASAPLLLYGYGSYGHNIDPYFSSLRLTLLDRGFVFAIAHIRGSETLGRDWYDNGKMLNKLNTFYDFIDCGKFLVENNFCKHDLLFAMGGSAGGLLMGAVLNLEPKMWKGVVAQVPFVDVLTTMLDESIPLTTGEFDEWGNPKNKAFYDYIKSYSPYDNVEAKDYPHMLITTGLHDSQVQYWEPAKWVAKLRDLKTDNNILLLQTEMDYGHGGASGRFEALKEVAMEYAFLLDLAGKSAV